MICTAYIDRKTKVALSGDALAAAMRDPFSIRCGHKLADDDKFCPMCGAIVERAVRQEKTVSHCRFKMSWLDDARTHLLGVLRRRGRSNADVRNPVGATARPDDIDFEGQEDEESVSCPNVAFGLAVVFFVIELAAIVGILIWSVYLSSTFWLIVLLCCLFAAVESAADTMVDIYKEAFHGEGTELSPEKAGVLHWVSVFLLCIPLTAPAYGFIQGGIESLRCIDDGKINLMTYFANKSDMNVLTRIGYRWIYHMCWDFEGAEDRILDTSPFGVLSQLPVNAMTGMVDDSDNELSQAEDDMRLGLKISTAMMKDDYAEARRLAGKISDKDLREFQLANIDQAESLKQSADDLKKSAKEFEDNMKAAAALQLLFGGR